MNKSTINKAITTVLCISAITISTTASAVINNYDWNGIFTMLDSNGAAIANTSTTNAATGVKGANKFQTPISGTMAFDTVTGAGTATINLFDFFAGTLPGEYYGITMQAIGDGFGDANGTLILANMLYSWGGTAGMPISVVLDAQGFYAGDLDGTGGLGTLPASDGTYLGTAPITEKTATDGRVYPATVNVEDGAGGFYAYLGLGPIPISTTAWNTTNGGGCVWGDCFGINPSGVLPLTFDEALNPNDYIVNTGGSIGGSPMQYGSFQGSNANFDFTTMTLTGTEEGTIGPFDVGQVPTPSAAWLFGSGLIGLIGMVRRKKS